MMSTVAKSVLLSSAILFSVATADAGVARHERVEISEVKKDSKVVGMKIKLTLRPEGYERVRVGIAPAGKKADGSHREAASDPKKGHLIHQFKEIKFDKQEPKKVELTVNYSDAKGLEPGANIELVSAFNKKSNASYWHVYGMTGAGGGSNIEKFTTPGKKAAKRKTGITQIRRSGKKNRTAQRKAVQRRRTRARANNVRKQRKQVRKQVRKAKPKARARR